VGKLKRVTLGAPMEGVINRTEREKNNGVGRDHAVDETHGYPYVSPAWKIGRERKGGQFRAGSQNRVASLVQGNRKSKARRKLRSSPFSAVIERGNSWGRKE